MSTSSKGKDTSSIGDAATMEATPSNSPQGATLTDPGASTRPQKESDLGDQRTIAEGEYEVVEEVARGGMGRILRAIDHRHHREVALKEALKTSPGSQARFAREALITARLQHPGIVPVYEFAAWRSGEPFFAMKLVDGRSLSAEISSADTVAKRLALLPKVIDAVEAIAYAHERRIIHRDLKPSNILVGGFGETVVIDWGLAKDLDADDDEPTVPSASSESDLTVAGSVIGTPSYMPLEQAEGETLDERADVYALGAILYHLLSGEPPFRAKSGDAVLALVRDHPPTPLSERDADIPADLVTIIDKAMARRREDRYASAIELAHELERFTTGQLVGAHRYSSFELLARRLRRHKGALLVSAVAAVAVVAIAGVSISRIIAERNEAHAAREDAELAQKRAEVAQLEADNQRSRAEGLVDFVIADLSEKLGPTGQVGLLKDVATRAHAYAATGDPDAVPTLDRQRRVAALLGNIRRGEGAMEDAEKSFRQELVFANKLALKQRSAQAKVQVAAAHRRVAEALAEQGRAEAAVEELARSKEMLVGLREVEIVLDEVNTELGEVFAAEGKVKRLADAPGGQLALGIADMAVSAEWEKAKNSPKEALAMLQVRARIADELGKGQPESALKLYDDILAKLDQSKLPAAVKDTFRASIEIKRGHAMATIGRDTAARASFEVASKLNRELADENPTDAAFARGHVLALAGRARVAKSPARAEKLLRKALKLSDAGNLKTDLGMLHAELGLSLAAQKKKKAARSELEKALGLLDAASKSPENRALHARVKESLATL